MSKSPREIFGPAFERLPAAQREVFESLSPEELSLAAMLQDRLEAASPEVAGQSNQAIIVC